MAPKSSNARPRSVSRTQAARSGPRVPVFAVALGVLVVVIVGVLVAIRLTDDGDDGGGGSGGGSAATSPARGTQAFAPVEVTGDALPPFPESPEAEDPAVGQAAPRLTGENPAGEEVVIDPAADGPMVIAFVAHWCPHCQAEVPRLVDLADGDDEVDGVGLVAVATRSDPAAPEFPPGEWLAGEDWPAPVLVDSEGGDQEAPTALDTYGVAGFPFLVAIDGDGKVVARTSGEQGDDGLRALFDAARG